MSCDNNQKAATKIARQNGIPKQASKLAAIEATASQKESLPELLSGETANVRRLLTLKNSKATIPASEVAKLFELEPDQPITEAVEGLADRFGSEAHLTVGKSTLGILTNRQEDSFGVQDVFITLPLGNGSPDKVAREEITQEDRNIQRLAAIKTAQEQVSGDEVARLIGMHLGQQLVHSGVIKRRFGKEASLALGKNTIGVIAETGNDNYGVREIFVTPRRGIDLAEKIKLKPADRGRIATNIERVHEAIKAKKKLIMLYNGPSGVRRYIFAPLDVTDGKTENTKDTKYMWVYSDNAKSILSMRMDRVLWTKASEESFDPVMVTKAALRDKEPDWALPREWGSFDNSQKGETANLTDFPMKHLKDAVPSEVGFKVTTV
jgi:hypothetical protein